MEYFKDLKKLDLKYFSCYLGVATSHGYLGAVAVAFPTSLLFLHLSLALPPVRSSYLALH